MSQTHLEAVVALSARIEEEHVFADTGDEVYFFKLLRFLRARKFDVERAFEMIKNDSKWRQEENRSYLSKETAEEVLRCDPLKIYEYFPTWLQGFDKEGRPVSYRKFGLFETWSVLKLIDHNTLQRFHAWESEMAIRKMKISEDINQCHVETFTTIVDAEGWTTRLATADAFTFIKGMAVTDSNHYPERLGTLIIINAPAALNWAFGVVKPFLDDVTKSKIQIFGCAREQWEPALFDLIDRDQVPMKYGGYAPDLSPEEAIASLNPPPTSSSSTFSQQRSTDIDCDDYYYDEEEEFCTVIELQSINYFQSASFRRI